MYIEKMTSSCPFNHVLVHDSYIFYSLILMSSIEYNLQKVYRYFE